jgi:hypothetical protein
MSDDEISDLDMKVIYRVAEAYGFKVRFDEILDRLSVVGSSRHSQANFYWASDEPFENFFAELQRFFTDDGVERYNERIDKLRHC